jgi:hypothetical protein
MREPLTADRFRSLAADGDEALITAMGVKKECGRVTFEDFANKTPIRDVGNSTQEDARPAYTRERRGRSSSADARFSRPARPPSFGLTTYRT